MVANAPQAPPPAYGAVPAVSVPPPATVPVSQYPVAPNYAPAAPRAKTGPWVWVGLGFIVVVVGLGLITNSQSSSSSSAPSTAAGDINSGDVIIHVNPPTLNFKGGAGGQPHTYTAHIAITGSVPSVGWVSATSDSNKQDPTDQTLPFTTDITLHSGDHPVFLAMNESQWQAKLTVTLNSADLQQPLMESVTADGPAKTSCRWAAVLP